MESLQSQSPIEARQGAPGVSIVIPAYNEERGIGPVLEQLSGVMTASGLPYEVIVVDDGSQDGTATVVGQYPGVTVLRHKGNRGYGAALKTGIRRARYDSICITDADGTYPNDRVPEMVARLNEGYDMVVGARTGAKVATPLVRRSGKWLIRRLGILVAGESIPDINSGFRVFRHHKVLRFFSILPDGFSFTTTITLAMLTNGFLVDYVPIEYYARVGRSKIKPLQDTLNFVQLILRIPLYFAPLKVFLPLGGLLFLLGLAWGLFSAFVLGRLADVSTLVIVLAGVQVVVVGLLAELINRRMPNHYQDND